jgi:SAM-dependent methyltransferase
VTGGGQEALIRLLRVLGRGGKGARICRLIAAVLVTVPPDAPPSDHLLRTMAAVPVSFRVLDLGCGDGRHTGPLLRLGFGVHACDPRPEAVARARATVARLLGPEQAEATVRPAPRALPLDLPDAAFDWVVAYRAELFASDADALGALLREAHRLLRPGGWCYLTVPAARADVPAEAKDAHRARSGDGRAADPPAALTPTEEAATAAPRFAAETLRAAAEAAGLAEASAPACTSEHGGWRTRVILRRPERP